MRIHDDLVRNGLSALASAQDRDERTTETWRATLTGIDNAAVFGSDAPGQQFLSSFLQGGGPAVLLLGESGLGGILRAIGSTREQMTASLDTAMTQEDVNRSNVGRSADPSSRA